MNQTIYAQIKPNSSQGPKIIEADAALIIYVREPATQGKANKAACKALAEYFGVPISAVTLNKGASSRYKTFIVRNS